MATEVIYRLHDVGVKGQGQFFMADNANSSFLSMDGVHISTLVAYSV